MESNHLLHEQVHQEKQSTFQHFKFRLPLINDKGGVFLIIWNVFLGLAFFSCATKLQRWQRIGIIEYSVALLVYPIIGFIADCYIGRFKVLKTSHCFVLLVVILKLFRKLVVSNAYILYAAIAFLGLDGSGYISVMLQFTLYQLVGASDM